MLQGSWNPLYLQRQVERVEGELTEAVSNYPSDARGSNTAKTGGWEKPPSAIAWHTVQAPIVKQEVLKD